ncbi:unnamed protein product [Rotaria socialis]
MVSLNEARNFTQKESRLLQSDGKSSVWSVQPGVNPINIGSVEFKTVEEISFSLRNRVPTNTQRLGIIISIVSGFNPPETNGVVNFWIWTECDGQAFTHFKQIFIYAQNAVSFDSETFTLPYCSSNQRIYVKSSKMITGWVTTNLYLAGYSI